MIFVASDGPATSAGLERADAPEGSAVPMEPTRRLRRVSTPGGARGGRTAWSTGRVVDALRSRGDLWTPAPGVVGLRGPTARLLRRLEVRLAALAAEETGDEWRTPPALPFETLARTGYFSNFPQWLTAASHLGDDPDELERVARSADPAAEVRDALAPASAALPPAVCYHTWAAWSGTVVDGVRRMTAQATCWRHEGERTTPLERGWAFTMREVACAGEDAEIEAFRRRGMDRAAALAAELGLVPETREATDPFYAPTSRGRELLQRVKGLKHELLLPVGEGRRIAAASFNHHERFFGEAFDIGLPDGRPASTGCVAFGVERWLLAFLVAHGPEPGGWPEVARPRFPLPL